MTTFDPVESEFDFFVDPLTADTQGLAILGELEKTKQIKGEYGPEFEAHIDAKQTKLKKNLTNYRDYKVNRDERLFNYAPEARARTAAMEEEKLAQTISGLFKADETTFNAFVEENGDTAWFKKGQHFMRGDSSRMRDEYLKDHILKLAGYSDRVIASGVAEPLMRARVGAKDSESEPTNEALSRWSLSKLNDMKRRKHVRDSTIAEVNKRFIGITGDVSDLPEAMEKLNPTDEERTLILRASNRHFEKLEEEYATIKPRVLKAFNTVAAQEDITSRLDADSYDNLVEAARDFSQNIPIQDFPKVVHMFAQVAEAHGEDVDSTMEKLAKSFSRGGSDLFGSAAVGYGDWFIGEFEETAKMRENKTFRSIQDAVAGVLGVEEEIKALDGGTKEARKEFDNFKAFYGELSNWREAVAKVGSDSWLVDSLVYGTARSLPEMGAAAAGIPGLMLVAAAAKERSMVEIRRDVAPGKWKKYEKVAVTSGIAYSLLNLAQFDTLSAKLPGTNSFLAEMGKRVFFEGLQESGQNLSMAFSLEFYGALDKDIEDLELKAEVWEAVKEFPLTMVAVSPLVLAGGLGQKALEYHDIKKFEKSLQDPDYLAVYGIEAEDQLVIRNLSVPDALDYIKDNNGRFLDNINGDFESSIAPPSGEVVFEEGRGVILGPRVTPDMLTRVERRLLPEEKEVADYERWKTQQGVDTGGMGMPIETMLEESYGDFLSDQLREAIGANEADGNKESIARIKAQQVFQERVQQLEKESVDESKAADDAARQAQQDRNTATAGFNARINASPDGTFSVTNGEQTMQAKSPEEAAEAAMALDPGYAKRNAAPQGDLKTAQENLRVAQEALAAEETAKTQATPDTTAAQNLSSMTQTELLEYFKKNGLPEGVLAYDALTARPEQRGFTAQERVDIYLANKEKSKNYGLRVTSLWSSIRSAGITGLEAIGKDSSWINFRINGDKKPKGGERHKLYVTFKESIILDVSNAQFEAYFKELQKRGYSGQAKLAPTGARALMGFDNIVLHGATKADVKLAQTVATELFGSDIQTSFGVDPKTEGQSYTGELAEQLESHLNKGKGEKGSATTPSDTTAAQEAVEEAQAAVDAAQAETKRNITDPRISPDFDVSGVTVMHSFLGPVFGSPTVNATSTKAKRVKEGLPPKNPNWGMRRLAALQKFITQRDIPSKQLQKILDSGNATVAGIDARFTKISNSYTARLKRHLKGVSKNLQQGTRDLILNDSYYGLRGDTDALNRLPHKIKEVVVAARKDIDLYSQWVIDSGLIKDEAKKAFGDNLGEYIKREFKVFDPEAQWNYDTILAQHRHIYDAALDDIMNNGKKKISRSEADEIIREMTHYSRARNFVNGVSSVRGIDVSSLIKKNNELSGPVLELLGEVVDPAANIRGTGGGVSRMLVTYQMQQQMAKTMVDMGVASKTKTTEFITQLGQESYTIQRTSKKGKVSNYTPSRTKKSMLGFDGYWFEPEIAAEVEKYFTGNKGEMPPIVQITDLLCKFSAGSKFIMVLFNPAAYPTNFMGGVNSELLNGRMFGRRGIGRKAYLKVDKLLDLKDAPGPYTAADQLAFYKQSGKDFGDVSKLDRRQLNSELQQLGILDNSVIGGDLLASLDSTVGASMTKGGKALKRNIALGYQAPDNAIKRSAFVHELDKWIRAEPDLKMDELVRRAGEDVRLTTQNYDQVPRILRYLSQRGIFVPTFVSFSWELGRNAKNTALVAYRELRSGNPVLVAAGRRRLVGMGVLSAALYGISSGISQWQAGLSDEEREELRGFLPEWQRHTEMAYLKAGNGKIQSFDPSYVMPHSGYYNMAVGVAKGATAGEKIENLWGAFDQAFLGQNILWETGSELSSNTKTRGGKIYNELTDVGWDPLKKQLIHVRRKMFKPGVERLFEKVKAIQKNEVGDYGSQPTEFDAWAMITGMRPTTTSYNTPEFMKGQLSQFSFDKRDIRSAISANNMRKLGKEGTPDPDVKLSASALTLWQSTKLGDKSDGSELNPKQVKEIEKVVAAEQRQKEEFTRKVVSFNSKKLGIPAKTILDAMKENNIPKYLQELYKDSKELNK